MKFGTQFAHGHHHVSEMYLERRCLITMMGHAVPPVPPLHCSVPSTGARATYLALLPLGAQARTFPFQTQTRKAFATMSFTLLVPCLAVMEATEGPSGVVALTTTGGCRSLRPGATSSSSSAGSLLALAGLSEPLAV